MNRREKIELGLKIIVASVAIFGVWKYFADRNAEVLAQAKERSLNYIARFADDNMVDARTELIRFWQHYPEFAAFARQGAMTEREYANFVAATYPVHPQRTKVDKALFQILVFYDEVAYCRTAGICNVEILDSYFCKYVVRHAKVYAPFYDRISAEIGSKGFDSQIRAFAEQCPKH